MVNIMMNNNSHEMQKLLFQCLEAAGFEVINIEDCVVSVELVKDKNYIPTQNRKSNIGKAIFPLIPRLSEVFEFIELNYHRNIKLK